MEFKFKHCVGTSDHFPLKTTVAPCFSGLQLASAIRSGPTRCFQLCFIQPSPRPPCATISPPHPSIPAPIFTLPQHTTGRLQEPLRKPPSSTSVHVQCHCTTTGARDLRTHSLGAYKVAALLGHFGYDSDVHRRLREHRGGRRLECAHQSIKLGLSSGENELRYTDGLRCALVLTGPPRLFRWVP